MKGKLFFCCILAAVLCFIPAFNTFALNLEDLVGQTQASALIAGEKPVLAQFKDSRPQLTPRHGVLLGLVEAICQDLEPSVVVETMHLYTKPPKAEKDAWSVQEEAELYNGVLALSTLAGLEYFSASRGAMRIFYETSVVIDGPSTKKPLPDPAYSRPLPELSIYARQKDLTFGDNIYQYHYYTAPGALIFTQQNLTSLTYGIIPAVGKNKLRTVVAVLDSGDYILIYAVSMAKAASLPGMKERVGNSFANRAEAVVNWFSNQADKAYRKVHS